MDPSMLAAAVMERRAKIVKNQGEEVVTTSHKGANGGPSSSMQKAPSMKFTVPKGTAKPEKPADWKKPDKKYGGAVPKLTEVKPGGPGLGGPPAPRPDLTSICDAVVQRVKTRKERITTPGYCMKVRDSCPLPCCQFLHDKQAEEQQQQKVIIKKVIRRRRPKQKAAAAPEQAPQQGGGGVPPLIQETPPPLFETPPPLVQQTPPPLVSTPPPLVSTPSPQQQQQAAAAAEAQRQQEAAAAAARQRQQQEEAERRRQEAERQRKEAEMEAQRQRQAEEQKRQEAERQAAEEKRQQEAAAAAAASAAPPAAPTQKVATFQNLGTDPGMAQAELYYESTRWGPLGHGDPPVSVGTFPGHRWFIVANGMYAKLFTVGEEDQQTFTF